MVRESLQFEKSWISALLLVALFLSVVGHCERGDHGKKKKVLWPQFNSPPEGVSNE
jgi:hypothetical protein